jgi:hypothetical protein
MFRFRGGLGLEEIVLVLLLYLLEAQSERGGVQAFPAMLGKRTGLGVESYALEG